MGITVEFPRKYLSEEFLKFQEEFPEQTKEIFLRNLCLKSKPWRILWKDFDLIYEVFPGKLSKNQSGRISEEILWKFFKAIHNRISEKRNDQDFWKESFAKFREQFLGKFWKEFLLKILKEFMDKILKTSKQNVFKKSQQNYLRYV